MPAQTDLLVESLSGNTAEQELYDPLFEEKEVRVFIKRDDLIHPFVSGNKWRKLRYILKDVQLQGKSHLLTFGGAYSNHLLATACLSAMAGLTSTGIVRGEKPAAINDTLFLCQAFGMKLIYVSREVYKDKDSLAMSLMRPDTYLIPEGGSSPEALQGCAELVGEFSRPYSHILLAAGTATTATGIAMGIRNQQLSSQVEAIVVLKGAAYLETAFDYVQGHSALPLNFHHEFSNGGYAKSTPELLAWMYRFIARTGIIIEPVYTAKALKALYQLTEASYFKKNSSILFIHTGGVLGLLGFKKNGV